MPEEKRARIEEYLKTLSSAALLKEADVLNHLLESPNADRAIAAYDWMVSMAKDGSHAARRLTPEIREELVRGVADRSSRSIKGVKGVLGQRHVGDVARALIAMSNDDYDRLTKTLNRAGLDGHGKPAEGADAHTERALMLKAVAARADRLKAGALDAWAKPRFMSFKTPAARAIDEVRDFAAKIRGMKREDVILATAALDIAEGTQCENPAFGLGNYQRYGNTCAPTIAQNVLAGRDPIFAMKVRAEFYMAEEISDIARQQKEASEKPRSKENGNGLVAGISRELRGAWSKGGPTPRRTHGVKKPEVLSLEGLFAEGALRGLIESKLPPDAFKTVMKYMTNQGLTQAEEGLAWNAILQISPDVQVPNLTRKAVGASEMSLEKLIPKIRSNYVRREDGTSVMKSGGTGVLMTDALAEIAPAPRGESWRELLTNARNGGLSDGEIARLDDALMHGTDVPINVGTIARGDQGKRIYKHGHGMMISDVRGEGPNRKYLVSDPAQGSTEWVLLAELRDYSSAWPAKYFGHGAQGIFRVAYEESLMKVSAEPATRRPGAPRSGGDPL